MARAKKSGGWFQFKYLKYVMILVSGSGAGAGGWTYWDTLMKVVSIAKDNGDLPDGPLVDTIKGKVQDVIDRKESFSREGKFEVAIDQLAIDAGLFKPGQSIDLQVQVAKLDDRGRKTVLWNSNTIDRRIVKVGTTPITTSWKVTPFELEWSPGDKMVIEVWDHKPLFSTKLFERTEEIKDGDKPIFPLSSGTYSLKLTTKGQKDFDPAVNQVMFTSRRIGGKDSPGGSLSPADAATAARDNDTIKIK